MTWQPAARGQVSVCGELRQRHWASLVSSAATGTNPQGVAVDPSGRFVYVTNHPGLGVTGSVSSYTINPSTGVLSPNGTIATGIEPY